MDKWAVKYRADASTVTCTAQANSAAEAIDRTEREAKNQFKTGTKITQIEVAVSDEHGDIPPRRAFTTLPLAEPAPIQEAVQAAIKKA